MRLEQPYGNVQQKVFEYGRSDKVEIYSYLHHTDCFRSGET
jgi:ArsR family metal-binding transcriptional regulator